MAQVRKSFNTEYSTAWSKLRMGEFRKPTEVKERLTKTDFDKLKADYVQKYGYTIRIPGIDEIVHTKPTFMKTPEEIKAEKKAALTRILASPTPEWAMTYSTIMTHLDNIQDATSVVYPAFSMLYRAAPKIFGKLLPVFGWMMLGTDLLNLAIQFGRLPFAGMKGKRAICDYVKTNPFTKTAQYLRKERLRNYKPGMGDLIQVLQTTDNLTGVGISLGPIMGTVMDAIFGAYRYATGERVKVSYDIPDVLEHEKYAWKAMTAMGIIGTKKELFTEDAHFWSYVTFNYSAMMTTPYAYQIDLMGCVQDPMNIVIPAPRPTTQSTIDVIQDAGLDVEAGVGWPYNQKKEILLSEYWDHIVPDMTDAFRDYCFRHEFDWNGYFAANTLDQIMPSLFEAFDPSGTETVDDSIVQRVIFRMMKWPILPVYTLTKEQLEKFETFILTHYNQTGRTPGYEAIRAFFDNNHILYRLQYPATREPEADTYWPTDVTPDLWY